ncbi:hypothetical protein F5I97DRAFT_1801655 [Phlebopus sp. FC_14]|nr:hypothetical protein F5I97DRAFT_1801655 [Phlebopus sp. FC_14]
MQSTTIPIRTRQSSTDSKDSKKKAAGLFNFGLFRTKSGSSKLVENPVGPAPPPARASVDHQRSHTDAPPPTATHRAHPSSVPKEAKERTTTSHPATLAYGGTSFSQSKPGTKVPDPISIPPPTNYPVRDRKDSLSNIFTPFKFLTMNNKRNRTISAASLDVCDGNTATNTVIGSPAHSTISQAPLFPPIVPPPVRDPMVATSQWRDREEAARRQRKSGRIRRPGVTFDVDEEPPPSATTKSRGAKLIRRKSGRAATPGPTSR